jgi:hypothetical protein
MSQVAQPVEVVTTTEIDVTGRAVRRDFHYGSHGFNVSLFWSPFLVKANLSDAEHGLGLWDMHLDTPDARWAAHIADFDYIVLSGTNWFFRPSVYREGGRVVGRNGGVHDATAEMPVSGAVRAAFRTALGAIAAREGFRGKALVRTVTPAHFENGEWNTGGDCVRARPFRRGERERDAVVAEFRAAQVRRPNPTNPMPLALSLRVSLERGDVKRMASDLMVVFWLHGRLARSGKQRRCRSGRGWSCGCWTSPRRWSCGRTGIRAGTGTHRAGAWRGASWWTACTGVCPGQSTCGASCCSRC